MTDLFPLQEFDIWAENYDQSVSNTSDFPFTGYQAVLDKVIVLANPHPGMCVLDLGTGTGNLAVRFDRLGCEIWGTDFSGVMLEKVQLKLPQAHLFQADLREPWPQGLNRRFDCIVSAYVFHHFELGKKVQIIRKLVCDQLEPGGKLIVADIAFRDQAALEAVKRIAGDEWDHEFYWLSDEILPAMTEAGLYAKFYQVSSCGGVFEITG